MSKTVLLLEASDLGREVLTALLRQHGYRVVSAPDGAAVPALAEQERPDLVLLDLATARGDSLDATRRLKAQPALRHIPVIAVSGRDDPDDAARALAAGCNACIGKPMPLADFLTLIASYLGRAGTAPLGPAANEAGAPP